MFSILLLLSTSYLALADIVLLNIADITLEKPFHCVRISFNVLMLIERSGNEKLHILFKE